MKGEQLLDVQQRFTRVKDGYAKQQRARSRVFRSGVDLGWSKWTDWETVAILNEEEYHEYV